MSFTSLYFVGLVLIALVLYYLLPKKARWAALLAASLLFYVFGGLKMAVYLIFAGAVTYLCALRLGALNDRRRSESDKAALDKLKRCRRLWAALAAVLSFGLLYMLKYWDFTAEALNRVLPGLGAPTLELVMPLGVSFYIFQSMGYVIDVYRDKYPPERNPLKYLLFVSFFPQMVQGPISRFDKLSPQLLRGNELDWSNVRSGLQLAMWGYFKKLVVADRAGVIVDKVFGNSADYGGAVVGLAVLCYCIQLYGDFSGGIDITRGVAKMFGIDMAENFHRPLYATTLTDYWRRWHISLGAWMKDYLFYPLSLSKPFARLGRFTRKKIGGRLGKIFPTSLATFIIYFIIGIWHGANFRYIAFGLWNGVLITAALLMAHPFAVIRARLKIDDSNRLWRLFCMLRTSFLVFIGRYMTRAPRLSVAVALIVKTFADFSPAQLFDGTVMALGLGRLDMLVMVLGVALIQLVEYYQEKKGSVGKMLGRRRPFVQWLAIFVPVAAILLFGLLMHDYVSPEFIYKQF